LKLKHFDENSNALLVENSKKGKSRCVPLSASMSCVIKNYINKRFGIQSGIERYIFEAPDGGRYSKCGVRSTIINIFKAAGVPTTISGRHARVHDVRHFFAVKSMEKMKLSGMDLYCAMPLLSMYLGHEGLRETEKYLWLPEFRMGELSAPSRQVQSGMIPEVTWDEE
jgi:integrase